jgi:endonuclease YncB( thermonuclease family)
MRSRTASCLVLSSGFIVGAVPFGHAPHEIPARVSRVANGDALTVFTANGSKLRARACGYRVTNRRVARRFGSYGPHRKVAGGHGPTQRDTYRRGSCWSSTAGAVEE